MRTPALAAAATLAWGCHHRVAPRATACPTAPVVASSQGDLDRLAGCARVPGLTIRSAAPLDLAPLAALAQVDGDLVIGPTLALTSVGLPALTRVGGRFALVSSAAATGLFAPRLEAVGSLEVRDDVSLTTISVPALIEARASVILVRLPALELLDHSALALPDDAVRDLAPSVTRLTPP